MDFEWIFGISNAVAEGHVSTPGDQESAPAAGSDTAAEVEDKTNTETIVDANGNGIPDNQETGGCAGIGGMFIPMILMVVVFYFFLIRPQRKKDKKVKEMLAALKPGDRVTTIGGIYGTIVNVKDETITLSIGSQRTEMVVTRWAIRQVEEVTVENDGELLA